jgi:hypothetical protein
MNTQLWISYFVPEWLPPFVSPYITHDYFEGRSIYIFEIDVEDELFARCKTPDNKCKTYLKYFGFIKSRKIYQGLRSEIFIGNNNQPPKLSELLPVWYSL